MTQCVSRYEMERQVEEVYTISKFKEFQEELTALMYCDISDSVGSIYQIIESFGQGRRGFFEVVFEEAECEVTCICSKFQFRGILCRHALAVLIRNLVELLPERYILSRWRKDVRRCYNIASDDENSYKTVLDWIEKTMKDLPKQIHCESVGKTNTGGASCSSNKRINSESVERTVIGEVSCGNNNVQLALNDPVVTRRKGRPPCLKKESSIRKKSVQKNKFAQKNKVPMYQSQFGGSNIYQSFPYNWHTQPVPPYTSQLHYSSPSMTYQGSQSTDGFAVSANISSYVKGSPQTLPSCAVVAELIRNQQWKEEVIAQHFMKDEAATILSIPLPKSPQPDQLIWHYDKHGNYSVKSGYQIALKLKFTETASSSDNSKTHWDVIWAKEIPQKIKDLEVNSLLSAYQMSGSAGYVKCSPGASNKQKKGRNKADNCVMLVYLTPPPNGWFKVNVDVAIKLSDQTAGLGVIIRDSGGKAVAAAVQKVSFRGDVVYMEAAAVNLGI
ncbi:hypothetical protein CUMW_219180 [Citrus unshiu]|uniref:Protein FAR1-RELATED SEQUENCE n=1 Tax=Citrus unshiu TaxID=55188 RepID=A0A2H5QD85_CITUN|nr:hypothetical protein CUMW_219180 [Citrus unshiu]